MRTEPITKDVRDYVTTNLYDLQQARLNALKRTTLADVFRGRNPYSLRAAGQVPFHILQENLDRYLASADEDRFAAFAHKLAAFLEKSYRRKIETVDIIEYFEPKSLPLRIELLEEYDRSYNRLTSQFYDEFCDNESRIDWERLTRFLTNSEV